MRNLILLSSIILISELILSQCANPVRPTGGPKDTIPPQLIATYPDDQTINFKGDQITLSFDEYVSADQLQQKLVITPLTDIKYKTLIKKRDIILKFEDPFKDSTTYMLNFFDAIKDITERNPAQNIIIAFSTGSYIDSLSLSGKVNDLMTNKPISKTTVGLYPITDSLDLFLESPYYFINTSDNGSFHLRNMKASRFILVSFLDENKNLKLDPATESYAFLSDTIDTSLNYDSLQLYQFQVDASNLTFISARPSGKYFDVRYSKKINQYHLDSQDTLKPIFSSLTSEQDVIRFYSQKKRPKPKKN